MSGSNLAFTPPVLIQGGMGVGVSSVRLANAVARRGQLGIVSGTALDAVLVRRLQDGDPDGGLRRALAAFPAAEIAERMLAKFFRPGGREPGEPYKNHPMLTHRSGQTAQDQCVLGAFAEVFLAKEGHAGLIGVNLLTKLQPPTIPTLYGAMLAGVDCVIMGAGIPRDIPGTLDALAAGRPADFKLDVSGADSAHPAPQVTFDPERFGIRSPIRRPAFFPIVASHSLATMLRRKASGSIEGIIVEGPTAGGHNAPPRGTTTYDATGQPIYGERDRVDFAAIGALGLPFWIAGGIGSPEAVQEAIGLGATGAQVGTLFAFCTESGLTTTLRHQVIQRVRRGEEAVYTDARASSTGYPFKVVQLAGTASVKQVYEARERVCDLGYLREAYVNGEKGIAYRCSAEPVRTYEARGGDAADTEGRKCLCNGLMANIGLGQLRNGVVEPALLTSGDGLASLRAVLHDDSDDYTADEVIDYLLPASTR